MCRLQILLKSRYKVNLLLGIVVLFCLFYGCEEKMQNESEVEIHFHTSGDVPFGETVPFIVEQMFNHAVYYNKYSLFSSIIRKSKNSWIFELKKNIYFESLSERWEASSKDLYFSITKYFVTGEGYELKNFFKDIIGLNVRNKIEISDAYNIPGIKIIDRYKIEITSKKSNTRLIKALEDGPFILLSEKAFRKDYKTLKRYPIGIGPYKVIYVNYKTGETRLKLKKDFIKQSPKAPRNVVIFGDDSHKGDIFFKDMWDIDKKDFRRVSTKFPYVTMGIFFNYNLKISQNLDFRKSLALAFKRDEIVEGFQELRANNQPICVGKPGRMESPENYDLKLSRTLMKRSLKEADMPREMDVIFAGQSYNEMKKGYNLKIKSQIEKTGLKVNFIKEKYGEHEFHTPFFISGISAPDDDPIFIFSIFQKNSIFTNIFPKKDRILSKKIEQLKNIRSIKERYKKSVSLSYYFEENVIMIPLYDLYPTFFFRTSKIKSLGDQPGGIHFIIQNIIMR